MRVFKPVHPHTIILQYNHPQRRRRAVHDLPRNSYFARRFCSRKNESVPLSLHSPPHTTHCYSYTTAYSSILHTCRGYLADAILGSRCDGVLYFFPPFSFLHSTNSCQVTVHALLWYRLSFTLLLISSVIRPDHPALWIALSTASILSHPWAGTTSGKYVALNVFFEAAEGVGPVALEDRAVDEESGEGALLSLWLATRRAG